MNRMELVDFTGEYQKDHKKLYKVNYKITQNLALQ